MLTSAKFSIRQLIFSVLVTYYTVIIMNFVKPSIINIFDFIRDLYNNKSVSEKIYCGRLVLLLQESVNKDIYEQKSY